MSPEGAPLAADSDRPVLHIPTPLLYSASMSKQAGCNIWLKLENMQPTQSFKIRGIGSICITAALERSAKRFVAFGDTNASLAVAYSGRRLGIPVTVFVPSATQASAVRAKIELEGAELREDGRTMKDAYKAACAFAQHAAGAVMIEGGDDAAAIAGNSTIVPEINVQLQRRAPAAIIAPVGSGGLLSGLITGLNRCRWLQVPVIAVETHNTNSFQQALLSEPAHSSDSETAADAGSDRPTGQCKAQLGADLEHGHHPPPTPLAPSLKDEGDTDNEVRPGLSANPLVRSESENVMLCFSRVRLSSEAKTSEPTVATCLLSEFVCPSALELAQSHPVVPISVSEAMAVEACRRLLDDHQFLIEIGSAAALSIVGKGLVRQILPDLDSDDHVVVVVTGGANISLDRLDSCRQRFAYPAPTIAKSGLEIFMRMPDPAAAVSAASSVQSLGGSSPSPAPARATATSYTHTTSAVSVPPSVCAQSILSASPVQL